MQENTKPLFDLVEIIRRVAVGGMFVGQLPRAASFHAQQAK
jgi:hypothetical protein